jgi:hypothetical protein
MVRGLLRFIKYLKFLEKFFEKNLFRVNCPQVFGGRSKINLESYRIVRSSGGPGRRPAGPWRTVRGAQRETLIAVDFMFLPLEFKHGQSVRTSRTVREVRVFDITASNGKGEYLYSMLGLGETLLAL